MVSLSTTTTTPWQAERKLTDAEMQSIGAVFTPETLPVLNSLAQEYAVFTNWHCEVPSCTFPNRTFYHAGTSAGRVDNDLTYNYAWDNDLPNLFDLFTEKKVPWKCYFPQDQVVPLTAINLAGARHWTCGATTPPTCRSSTTTAPTAHSRRTAGWSRR